VAKVKISAKQLQINKANTRMIFVVGAASFVVVFSLVASKTLLGQRSYQKRVINQKNIAVKQLQENISTTRDLVNSYKNFNNTPENVLGGNPKGSGEKDGDNAKIILDALPSKYDFPALATSLEKILTKQNYKIESIVGTDDEINQQDTSSPNPQPVEIPFQITVSASYSSMKNLMRTLQNSIRPIQIQTIEFSGQDNDLRVTINAKTFYQPGKNLNITTKDVK